MENKLPITSKQMKAPNFEVRSATVKSKPNNKGLFLTLTGKGQRVVMQLEEKSLEEFEASDLGKLINSMYQDRGDYDKKYMLIDFWKLRYKVNSERARTLYSIAFNDLQTMSQRQAHTRAAHFCEQYFEKYHKELEGWDDFWKFYLESNYKPHQERLIGIKLAQTFSDFPKESIFYNMILVARWDQYYKNSIKYTGLTPEMRAKLEEENRIKEEEKLENQKNKRLKKVVKKVLRIES